MCAVGCAGAGVWRSEAFYKVGEQRAARGRRAKDEWARAERGAGLRRGGRSSRRI